MEKNQNQDNHPVPQLSKPAGNKLTKFLHSEKLIFIAIWFLGTILLLEYIGDELNSFIGGLAIASIASYVWKHLHKK